MKKQQNLLPVQSSSPHDSFNEHIENPPLEFQQDLSDVLSLKQTQAENELLKLHHQRK